MLPYWLGPSSPPRPGDVPGAVGGVPGRVERFPAMGPTRESSRVVAVQPLWPRKLRGHSTWLVPPVPWIGGEGVLPRALPCVVRGRQGVHKTCPQTTVPDCAFPEMAKCLDAQHTTDVWRLVVLLLRFPGLMPARVSWSPLHTYRAHWLFAPHLIHYSGAKPTIPPCSTDIPADV